MCHVMVYPHSLEGCYYGKKMPSDDDKTGAIVWWGRWCGRDGCVVVVSLNGGSVGLGVKNKIISRKRDALYLSLIHI